jgi:hypothetical protein
MIFEHTYSYQILRGCFVKLSWIGYTVLVVATMGISLDILIFILANILLSVSYKSELFIVYSFMAFGSLFLVISNVITISLLLAGVSSSSYIGIFWIISIGMYALGSDVRLRMGTD